MAKSPLIKLNDDRLIPQLGFGVWQVADQTAQEVVGLALEAGYRHIDTAKVYENEAGVGRAINSSAIARSDLWVTTKIWNDDQGYQQAQVACQQSLERLGLDYLDLLLIHWVSPHRQKYLETWQALIELHRQGLAKSIGVSNFPQQHLQEIIDQTGVVPAVNQVELHPYFNQAQLRQLHKSLGIKTEAWSPLGQGGQLLSDPLISDIAARHKASPAQVIIAWHLAQGNIVFPKSVTPARIKENFAALDLSLNTEDIKAIDGLSRQDGRIGPDPLLADF
ncbi:MAG: aldo/keto reductase [Rothia sp. (in: high G+C Gram-positive bacteria)]|nr:aldo/keto reductase [Rothia sp. (in: high G+C Gram-positive bacteria)]